MAFVAMLLLAFSLGCSRSPRVPADPTQEEMEADFAELMPDAVLIEPEGRTGEILSLRLHVEAGQTYRMELHKEQNTDLILNDQTIPTRRAEVIEGTWEILETGLFRRDLLNTRFTFDRLRFLETTPHGEVNYDTASDDPVPSHMRAQTFSALAGQSLEMTVTPSARIVDMRGGDELRERVISVLLEEVGEITEQIEANLELLTDEAMAYMLEAYFATLPGVMFPIGGRWTEMRPLVDLNALNERTIHIRRRENGKVVVTRDSIMMPRSPEQPMGRFMGDNAAMQIHSGTAATRSYVDEATGWLINARTEGETRSQLVVRHGDGDQTSRHPMITRELVIVRRLGDGVEPLRNLEGGITVQQE